MEMVAAEACDAGADTLVTIGGVQSNHARVTAATAAKLGMRCVLVLNGEPPSKPAGNALLDALLGAEIHYVADRAGRVPAMQRVAERLRAEGRRPFEIPLGASTPTGALGYARAVLELEEQGPLPDAIVHSTSSGGTQAGLTAGCAVADAPTVVLGISADDPAATIVATVREILGGMETRLAMPEGELRERFVTVDDRFVGAGYGIPSDASREAAALVARTEAIFLDPTYSAKAMAGLIAGVRAGAWNSQETVLFWHTGGLPGIFA
jgi:1-aminocyclopropane-1-carboxylate deaminase/D-cysteine desulfhydrase-like pyridoxal-dependent ACC family enzyme